MAASLNVVVERLLIFSLFTVLPSFV